jgi:recombination protein RecA
MSTAQSVMQDLKKKYGDQTVTVGVTLYEAERIPTGIFDLDYATGGGIPRGRLTEIYGPESSCKTNIVVKAMQQAQKLNPTSKVVFIDAENAMTGSWLVKMGVDPDRLIYVRPDMAEQVLDAAPLFLEAEDVSMLLIDSTAALVTNRELEQDADKSTPGNATILIQRLVKACVVALNKADKAYVDGERMTPPPAWVMINQVRFKVGVVYGSPETTPGGQSPKFAAGLRLRTYGKNKMDPKISKAMPAYKDVTVQLVKWKVPVLATEASFDMAMIPNPKLNLGEVDSWGLVEQLLEHFGMLAKDPKKGYWLNTDGSAAKDNGIHYPTLKAIYEQYREDFMFRTAMHNDLFAAGRKEAEGDEHLTENDSEAD